MQGEWTENNNCPYSPLSSSPLVKKGHWPIYSVIRIVMTLNSRTKPTKTNNILYPSPAMFQATTSDSSWWRRRLRRIRFSPATVESWPSLRTYAYVRGMMRAILRLGIFNLLLTLLMAECITRPIIVKLAMRSITTGPLINPDQIHESDFYARWAWRK